MEITEAKKQLKQLAKGKCHSVTRTIVEYSTGLSVTEYVLYIDDEGNFAKDSFEGAFSLLRESRNKGGDADV